MRRITRIATLIVSLMALTVGMDAYAAAPPTRPGALPVVQSHPGPGRARLPLWLKVHGYDAHGKPLFTTAQPAGYTPQQIANYLDLTGQGSGQTIAIVDAFGSPTIASDLATFDSTFGLPAPPSFVVATPEGAPQSIASDWAAETSLDVEWAHAIAPQADILLVEALDNSGANLQSAIAYAAAQAGVVVISNSWGEPEFPGETLSDETCALASAVCTVSSGDSGNPGDYPAYNPYAIAVGGTTLSLTSSGGFVSESAWSESGGGVSQYEARPAYQAQVNPYSGRGIPDVSYDANPATGVSVYDSTAYGGASGWFVLGGTSVGAPSWAAIIADADQLRQAAGVPPLGSANFQAGKELYGLKSGLYDVTSGSNGTCGSICDAGPGYDFVTGLGSPEPGIDTSLTTPTVAAGGGIAGYSGAEGSAIGVSGTAADSDGDTITTQWSAAANSGTGGTCTFADATALNTTVTCSDQGSYTLTLSASDGLNPAAKSTAQLTVSNAPISVGTIAGLPSAPVAVNTPVTASATFTDPGTADSHTATIDWGDGTSSAGSVSETAGTGTGSVTGGHSYAAPGVYTVTAAVYDGDSPAGTGGSTYQYVTVYDPAAGFVTGSGTIDSPAGAFPADPTLTGPADFGFVSTYRAGSNTPVGRTEFQFQAGDLNFLSSNYGSGSLVISGPLARYTGTGTVAGSSDSYSFLVEAYDCNVTGNCATNPDGFRIQITDTTTNTLLYDNVRGGSGALSQANTEPIATGDIVIHRS